MLLAKQNLEVLKAQYHIRARANDELTAADDRKAWVMTQFDVHDAELVYLTAQADYKGAELKYEAVDDLFSAVRKLANMRIADNESVNNANKYERSE
jgi:hypothetical protein